MNQTYHSFRTNSLLRVDWAVNLSLSDVAQRIAAHQRNCHLSRAEFRYRNRFGLGSDLHLHSQALCNAMAAQPQHRVWTQHKDDPWIFWDQRACSKPRAATATSSSMDCYFPNAEPECPADIVNHNNNFTISKLYRGRGRIGNDCQENGLLDSWNITWTEFRRAGIEWLFSRLSPTLVQTAEQLAQLVFVVGGGPAKIPPADHLITVHIRWGDKGKEMKLVSIQDYIQACHKIVRKQQQQQQQQQPHDDATNQTTRTGIFLLTEDPKAVQAMRTHLPPNWNLFVDPYVTRYAHHRQSLYNGDPQMTRSLHGEPGRVALASLLVALEANHFVLTTASNWSLLLNELRLSVLEARDPGSTTMIDLRPAR